MSKCRDCGTEINDGEYKTFGVCDDCWDKAHPQNLPKANAYSLLAEVRADVQELLKSIDEYHESFSVKELESFSRQKLDAGVKMMRLKNKVSEHFS